jgi:hypothetical protein
VYHGQLSRYFEWEYKKRRQQKPNRKRQIISLKALHSCIKLKFPSGIKSYSNKRP